LYFIGLIDSRDFLDRKYEFRLVSNDGYKDSCEINEEGAPESVALIDFFDSAPYYNPDSLSLQE